MAFCFFLMETDRLGAVVEAEEESKLFTELFGEKEQVTIIQDGQPISECALFREFLEHLITNNLGYVQMNPDAATVENGECVKVFAFHSAGLSNTQFVIRPQDGSTGLVSRIDRLQLHARLRDP